ncbi:hypothetical protein D3C83_40830 [compost metagenome]
MRPALRFDAHQGRHRLLVYRHEGGDSALPQFRNSGVRLDAVGEHAFHFVACSLRLHDNRRIGLPAERSVIVGDAADGVRR